MYAVADRDLQLSGGGGGGKVWGSHPEPEMGGWSQNQFFWTLWASVWSKNKGGPGPLDLPVCMYQKHLDFTSQLQYHCVSSTHHNMFLL